MPLLRLAFACALLLPGAAAQEMGGEYDYSNYQAGMEAAPQVVAGDGRARRQGVLMNFACGALGYAANGMLNRAHGKKVMKKAQAEKDHLISVLTVKKMENQQLQYVVQQYEYQIHELQRALYDSEAEGLQRDYEAWLKAYEETSAWSRSQGPRDPTLNADQSVGAVAVRPATTGEWWTPDADWSTESAIARQLGYR